MTMPSGQRVRPRQHSDPSLHGSGRYAVWALSQRARAAWPARLVPRRETTVRGSSLAGVAGGGALGADALCVERCAVSAQWTTSCTIQLMHSPATGR